MTKIKTLLLTAIAMFCYAFVSAQYIILNFEEDSLPLDTFITAGTANPDTNFVFSGLEFPSNYDAAYGGFWTGGWALSTSRNDTVGDFSNLFGAATGGGFNGSSTYLVGQEGAYILLPPGSEYAKLYATNTAYTANVLRNGSAFSRPFGIDTNGVSGFADSLFLTITAYENDEVTFNDGIVLADYRFQEDSLDYILTDWRANDHFLPSYSFRPADSISFRMISSDSDPTFGNNTPNFFAIDAMYVILGTSSTKDLLANKPLEAWPNPASNTIYIGKGGAHVQLHIADMSGRVLQFHPGYSLGQPLNISSLSPGNYIAVTLGGGLDGATQIVVR